MRELGDKWQASAVGLRVGKSDFGTVLVVVTLVVSFNLWSIRFGVSMCSGF